MPAYRSSAEGEIRTAVVDRLRIIRPNARIMHEVNCACFGPNRIDVIAVDTAEIIAVEIKSEKDKLTRLAAQIASMRTMSHHVIAALHEKFLVEWERPTNESSAHYERDGQFWMRDVPREARDAIPWVFPERRRTMQADVHPSHDRLAVWKRPDDKFQSANLGCLDMLWAEEMRLFCQMNGLHVTARSSRGSMLPLIRWNCTGGQITKGVCAILRARKCPEADAPIELKVAA